jgi:hypothetical protein
MSGGFVIAELPAWVRRGVRNYSDSPESQLEFSKNNDDEFTTTTRRPGTAGLFLIPVKAYKKDVDRPLLRENLN